MEFLDSLFVREVSGWGAFGALAILVVVSIIRGWLVPGRTHERELKAERSRGDEYKAAALESRAQNTALLETVTIVQDFFKKVPVEAKERS